MNVNTELGFGLGFREYGIMATLRLIILIHLN